MYLQTKYEANWIIRCQVIDKDKTVFLPRDAL